MKKLISMTDFVLEQENTEAEGFLKNTTFHKVKAYEKISAYANFLKRPLGLWMFVPCDDEGNVLGEPEMYGWFQNVGGTNSHATEQDGIDCDKYHYAKIRCLFEGFEESKVKDIMKFADNIEDISKFNFELTQTAIKQLSL